MHSGFPIEQILGFSTLVDVDNVKSILRFYLDRNGGVPNKMTSDIAQGLAKVALRYLEVPEDQMDELRALKKRVKVEINTMTPKNRAVLRRFNDDEMVARFKGLPWTIVDQVQSGPVNSKSAIALQKAIAMIILMHAPMRLKNLCGLHLERHLNWHVSPGKLLVVVSADEVKNEEELTFELPPKAVRVIQSYIKTYRPLPYNGQNDHLFPGINGRAKSSNNLSQQIARFTFQHLGVRLTSHQFRHLMGKTFLDNCPGQYEVLRRVLGHRSIDTTISYYAGEETRSAVQHYQDKIFDDLDTEKKGILDAGISPGPRLSKVAINGFAEDLEGRVASTTAASRLSTLSRMIRVLDYDSDRSWLITIGKRYARRARPSRN